LHQTSKLNTDVVNSGPFEVVNALDFNQIEHLVEVHKSPMCIVAALLSATAEKTRIAWDLNMNSLFHVLNLAKAGKKKNILAFEYCRFGPTTPKENTPQYTVMDLQRFTESVNGRKMVRILP
jgi:hypothetical protein